MKPSNKEKKFAIKCSTYILPWLLVSTENPYYTPTTFSPAPPDSSRLFFNEAWLVLQRSLAFLSSLTKTSP
ncbi:42311_t:CDS:1, partial [Gigaspora margarita]